MPHYQTTIGFIPEDDRPVSLYQPKLLAGLAGYQVLTPPLSLLGHRTTPGQCDEVGKWLLRNANRACGWVIALDMLVYGGLVASRELHDSLNISLQRLRVLEELHKVYHGPVYAFQPIRRLSITVKSSEDLAAWEKEHHSNLVTEFRLRNHHINCQCLEYVAQGCLDWLSLLQEDARAEGPHREEQRRLLQIIAEKSLQAKTVLTPGTDEGGLVLLARLIQHLKQRQPRAMVIWSSQQGARRTALYEDRPVEETINGQLQAAGVCQISSAEETDFLLYIWAPDWEQKDLVFESAYPQKPAETADFISQMKQAIQHGHSVVLADLAYGNGADDSFMTQLAQCIPLNSLRGYSAWNTSANAVGYAIAQGCLPVPDTRFLLLRLLEDWGYQAIVRSELNRYLKERCQADVWKLAPDAQTKAQKFLRPRLAKWNEDHLLPHWEDTTPCWRCSLPWERTFELGIRL